MGADEQLSTREAGREIELLLRGAPEAPPADQPPQPREPNGRFARSRAEMVAAAGAAPSEVEQIKAILEENEAAPAPPQPEGEEPAPAEEEEPRAEEPTEGEPQPGEITDVDGLAREFGVEVPELLSSIHLDDGAGGRVPLAEVVEHYRNRHAPDPVANQRMAALDTREAQLLQREDAGLRHLQGLAEQLIATLQTEEPVDLARLEQDDPVAWVKAKEKARSRQEALAATLQRLKQADAQQAARAQDARLRYVGEQSQLAIEMMPEWRDHTKAVAAMAQVQRWLSGNGPGRAFSAQEIAELADARQVITAWKASEYDRLMAKKPAVLKSVRGAQAAGAKPSAPTPRSIPAGARASTPGAPRKDKLIRASQDRLARTGDVRDAARVFQNMGI